MLTICERRTTGQPRRHLIGAWANLSGQFHALTAGTAIALRQATLTVVLLTTGAFQAGFPASIDDFRLRNFDIGGNFVLTDQNGRKASLEDFGGKVVLLFFGFTHCPDVCPTTMVDMGRLLTSLGDDIEHVRAVFVTVDPDRDTPDRLKRYLSYFHAAIVGVTGSVEEIEKVAGQYSSRIRKQMAANGVDYSVDHTSFVYIIDQTGKVRYVVPYDIGTEMMSNGVRSLLDDPA